MAYVKCINHCLPDRAARENESRRNGDRESDSHKHYERLPFHEISLCPNEKDVNIKL